MKYRKFGKLGWDVSEIGFGAWALGGGWGPRDDRESVAALHEAFELGCNFVDTAQGYGNGHSERVIARALREWSGTGRIHVATKIPPLPGEWPPGPYDRLEERFTEDYLRERLERSLRDLGTDCIDLLQIHTWTRAWNRDPMVWELLRTFRAEGKVRAIGVSTPEHDQHSVLELVRNGWVDSVQLIYNIFDQEAQAELLPVAREHQVAVIVRVAFDESALTGKLEVSSRFGEDDVRSRYFAGDRLARTVQRVEKVRETAAGEEPDLVTTALKFALKPDAVSTVIPGIRSVAQARMNLAVSDLPAMSNELERKLRSFNWRRGVWYAGK
jgi:aryl-alcohol dehydrogenase-like predicted oxidoreductase